MTDRGLAIVFGAALAASCTAIAGLDGEYTIGQAGAGATSGPSSGGGQVGPGGGTQSTATSANGGATTGPGAGGMAGAGGGNGGGGAPATFVVPCDNPNNDCPPGKVCCISMDGNGNTLVSCENLASDCNSNEFAASCDGPGDCMSGQVCCGHFSSQQWISIQCAASCSDYAGGDRIMCGDGMGGNSMFCTGMTCIGSMFLPGYFYCTN